MKKAICASALILIALLLLGPRVADAHGPGRVHFGAHVLIGPGYWWPGPWWGPGWWGARYYSYSPPVVVQQAPAYVQPSRLLRSRTIGIIARSRWATTRTSNSVPTGG